MDQSPKEFDWVTERANCTAAKIFNQLRFEVEKDVELRRSHAGPAFSFEVHDEMTFSVLRQGTDVLSHVQFRLDRETILVRDAYNQPVMKATLALNDTGECVLQVTESGNALPSKTELRTWQFRRRALERLFFDFRQS